MNEQWRDALGAAGPIGATPERIDEIGVSDQLIQRLLVAGLLRIDRLNHADAYGALVDQGQVRSLPTCSRPRSRGDRHRPDPQS